MYKSPIEVLTRDIYHQIKKQEDEQIYEAVLNVGVSVDKDELIRALQYDRGQYEKGYADAMDSIVRCEECRGALPGKASNTVYCQGWERTVSKDGFCSYGERRTDG